MAKPSTINGRDKIPLVNIRFRVSNDAGVSTFAGNIVDILLATSFDRGVVYYKVLAAPRVSYTLFVLPGRAAPRIGCNTRRRPGCAIKCHRHAWPAYPGLGPPRSMAPRARHFHSRGFSENPQLRDRRFSSCRRSGKRPIIRGNPDLAREMEPVHDVASGLLRTDGLPGRPPAGKAGRQDRDHPRHAGRESSPE